MGAIRVPHKATIKIYNSFGTLYTEEFKATSLSGLLKLIQLDLIGQLKIYPPDVKKGLKYSIDIEQI